ncbi:MAG: tetratricopeptide repeat protein [Planctomycetota bacterium]
MLLVASCATGRGARDGSAVGRSATLAPGVDATRALVPLGRVEPTVERPKKPEAIAALSERAAKQIAAARRLIDDQRYTEASLELERALRYDPNHFDIHRALALLHWEAGNVERAKTAATRAIEGNPDCAAAHYILGRCQALAGDRAAAHTEYRTALLCSDFDQEAETAALCHYYLADALAAESYLQAALGEYDAFEKLAVSLKSSAARGELVTLLRSTRGSAGEERSRVLEKLGRFGEAASALAPIVAASPQDTAHGARYAKLLAAAGHVEEALAAARAIPSDDPEIITLLLDLHERAGHPERIVEDLKAKLAARPDDPRLVLNLVDALTRLRRFGDARGELEDFLARNADAPDVRLRLIEVLSSEGAWSETLEACAEGIRRGPDRAADFEARIAALAADPRAAKKSNDLLQPGEKDDFALLYLRGLLATAVGQADRAEALLRRAVDADARFVPARVALAEIYLKSDRYDEALTVAARADADRPEDARLERVLGQVYDRLDDIENAELHNRAASQLDRADTESMLALVQLYRRSDRGLQAQRQLRVLLEKEPGHELARELLALTYFKDGKPDVAFQEIEELRRRSTSPTTIARCRTLLEPALRRDPAAGREVLLEAMKEGRPDAATWIAVAETYGDGEPDKAHEAYLNALAVDPDNEDAAIGAARTAQRLLVFEEAAQRLQRLLQRRPNRHEWRLALIDLCAIIQDYDAALDLARTQEARGDLPSARRKDYRRAVIETLHDADRSEEAIAQLKAWADAESDEREWTLRLAAEYRASKQAALAVPLYERVYQADRKDQDARDSLIVSLALAARHDRAAQYLLEWLDDDPDNDQVLRTLCMVLADAKRFDDALELARTHLLRTRYREQFQNVVLDVLNRSKRDEECIDLIQTLMDEVMTILRALPEGGRRRAVERPRDEQIVNRPNEPATLEALSERLNELRRDLIAELLTTKRYREAEQQLSTWLEASTDPPTRVRYLLALAECQRSQGNEQQAGAALERALVLLPTDMTLNNDMAYLWIDQGVRLVEAEKLIRYSVGRAPRQAAYLDTYGWLLYKKGQFVEAKKWLSRANHARDGKDPVIHDHLGDTCWRLGQPAEAIEHWSTAIRLSAERDADRRINDDERRVRMTTPKKIEDGSAGREPSVAPLAAPASPSESGSHEGT